MSQHRKLFESNSKLPTVAISPDDQQEESDCLTLTAVMHRRSSTVLVYLCHACCVWLVQWVLRNACCIDIVLLSICLLCSSPLCLMCCVLFLCSWFYFVLIVSCHLSIFILRQKLPLNSILSANNCIYKLADAHFIYTSLSLLE
jgi:hypothetical protein